MAVIGPTGDVKGLIVTGFRMDDQEGAEGLEDGTLGVGIPRDGVGATEVGPRVGITWPGASRRLGVDVGDGGVGTVETVELDGV